VTVENDDFFFGWIVLSDDIIKYVLKNEWQMFHQLQCLRLNHMFSKVVEVKSMLLKYGFFLWMVLILSWVVLWTIWIFSFGRSQVSDVVLGIYFYKWLWFCRGVLKVHVQSSCCCQNQSAGLWGVFFINVSDFLMVC
jgi:hypothetical protein